jgi:hypothetical protein
VLIANGSSFQKVVGIFFSLGLGDILLNVLIEPDCLVQINCLLVIEVDIIKNLLKFGLLLLAQFAKCFLLWDQCAAEKSGHNAKLTFWHPKCFILAYILLNFLLCNLCLASIRTK